MRGAKIKIKLGKIIFFEKIKFVKINYGKFIFP